MRYDDNFFHEKIGWKLQIFPSSRDLESAFLLEFRHYVARENSVMGPTRYG